MHSADVVRVLQGGPWCVDNILLVLKRWDRSVVLNDEIFQDSYFWVHIRGLPRECVTLPVGIELSALFEGCREL